MHELARLSKIREIYSEVMHDPRVVNLGIGDPHLPVPPPVLLSIQQHMLAGHTHYEQDHGARALRYQIANLESVEYSHEVDPEQHILVTHGAMNGLYVTLRSLLVPGSAVLILEPCWIPFTQLPRLLGCEAHLLSWEDLSLTEFRAALERLDASGFSAVLFASPSNPTGRLLPREFLIELIKWTRQHDITIVQDEAYRGLEYGGHRVTRAICLEDNAVSVSTLSKVFSMTGLRVGWVITRNAPLMRRIQLQASYTNMCCNTPVQLGVSDHIGEYDRIGRLRAAHYRESVILASTLLNEHGVEIRLPDAGFYLLARHKLLSSKSLLTDRKVAVMDGALFGQSTAGWIRISCCVPQNTLKEGLLRLEQALR